MRPFVTPITDKIPLFRCQGVKSILPSTPKPLINHPHDVLEPFVGPLFSVAKVDHGIVRRRRSGLFDGRPIRNLWVCMLLILLSQRGLCRLRNSLTSSPRHSRHPGETLLRKTALFPFYYKPSIGVRAVFRSGRRGSSLSIRHYHFYSSAREDKQKVKASGSNLGTPLRSSPQDYAPGATANSLSPFIMAFRRGSPN
jgi:hypothetical protein